MNFIRQNNLFSRAVAAGFVALFGAQAAMADGILFYKNQGGRTYLLFGVNHQGELDIPGGRRDPGETFAQAAAREAAEELCLPMDSAIHNPFNVRKTRSYKAFLSAAQGGQKVGKYYVIAPYPGGPDPAANFKSQKAMCRKLGHQYREMSNVVWKPCDHFSSDSVVDREVRQYARATVKAAVRQFGGGAAKVAHKPAHKPAKKHAHKGASKVANARVAAPYKPARNKAHKPAKSVIYKPAKKVAHARVAAPYKPAKKKVVYKKLAPARKPATKVVHRKPVRKNACGRNACCNRKKVCGKQKCAKIGWSFGVSFG